MSAFPRSRSTAFAGPSSMEAPPAGQGSPPVRKKQSLDPMSLGAASSGEPGGGVWTRAVQIDVRHATRPAWGCAAMAMPSPAVTGPRCPNPLVSEPYQASPPPGRAHRMRESRRIGSHSRSWRRSRSGRPRRQDRPRSRTEHREESGRDSPGAGSVSATSRAGSRTVARLPSCSRSS